MATKHKKLKVEDLKHLGSLITLKVKGKGKGKGKKPQCLGFLMNFPGHGVYDANYGRVPVSEEDAKTHNKLLSVAMIEGLDTCEVGQSGMFYGSLNAEDDGGTATVATFTGEVVTAEAVVLSKWKWVFERNGRKFSVDVPPDDDGNLVAVRRVS